MKKALLFVLAALALFSCGRDQYRIHGRVTANDLEGIQIFLVPIGHEEPENVDSVHIRNHEFFFKGKKHWMCEIRLDRYHRDKGQNLIVATEPGDIYVTIGPDSHGGGTPMNDSLQVWKDLTIQGNKDRARLRRYGTKEQVDSAWIAYRDRSRAMGLAFGEDSMLGQFFLERFPIPKEQ
jgi:hypothetical protein